MSIERIIAHFMRFGSLAAIALCVLGVAVLSLHGDIPAEGGFAFLETARCDDFCEGLPGAGLVLIGVASLVGVSVGRLLLCAVLFLHEGDAHYAGISLLAVALVAAASLFRLAG